MYAVITGLVMAVLSQYEIRIAYIVSWIIIFYLLYDIAINRVSIVRKSAIIIVVLSILGLSNIYWILPTFAGGQSAASGIFYSGLFGESYYSLRQAIVNFHPFWTGDKPSASMVQPIPMRFFLVPILAFIPLVFKRTDKRIFFFAVLVLLGIFLTKQSAQPFAGAYRWLYLHFPGFNAFREPSKFYLIINLSYSVLAGHGVNMLNSWINVRFKTKYIGEIFVFVVVVILLWNAYALISHRMPLTKSKTIPKEYIEFKNHLLSQSTFYRTMGVPRVYRYSFFNTTHPAFNASLVTTKLWDKPDFPVYDMINLFQYPHLNWLFDIAGIKYIYLPYDIEKEMFDYVDDRGEMIRGYGKDRDKIENVLDNLKWLSNKKQFGNIITYENRDFLPHIYTTSSIAVVK